MKKRDFQKHPCGELKYRNFPSLPKNMVDLGGQIYAGKQRGRGGYCARLLLSIVQGSSHTFSGFTPGCLPSTPSTFIIHLHHPSSPSATALSYVSLSTPPSYTTYQCHHPCAISQQYPTILVFYASTNRIVP